MKRTGFILGIIVSVLVLSGCCLKHEWIAASCEEPAHCAKCGKTKGEALGHSWVEATCTEPRTCSLCGKTEGEALGHKWEEATCTEPKTCSVCNETEGEALGHDWKAATLETPKTCTRCGETEGDPVKCEEINPKDIFSEEKKSFYFFEDTIVGFALGDGTFSVYDYDGNIKKDINFVDINFVSGAYQSYSYCIYYNSLKNNVAIFTTYFDKSNNGTIKFYDQFGEEKGSITLNLPLKGWLVDKEIIDDRYILMCDSRANNTTVCIDTETMSIVDAPDVENGVEYDQEKYGYCRKRILPDKELYFVSNPDETIWGYTDQDFNEIAMYADATDFNKSGYALVSEDRKTYSIIDSDFNIVAENCMEGDSAWWCGGNVLAIQKGNEIHYYSIK